MSNQQLQDMIDKVTLQIGQNIYPNLTFEQGLLAGLTLAMRMIEESNA